MFSMFQSLFGQSGSSVTPTEAVRRINAGARIVDVREPEEFAHGSIAQAVNVPLSRIDRDGVQALASAGIPAGEGDVLVICRSGARSGSACAKLREALGARAINLEGGLMAWVGAGLPVHRGQS